MESINTKIINSNKCIFFAALYMFLSISINLYISLEIIHNILILFIGVFITFIPLIFYKKFQEKFTTNAIISFSNENINLKLFGRLSINLVNNYDFKYNQIGSFLAKDATKDNGSYLILKMKNNGSYSFRFLDEEKTEITNLVFKHVLEFNESIINNQNKIKLTPGFFATKSGKIAVYILTALLIITVTVEIIFLEKCQSYLIIPGIVIYLGILLQRKNDLDTVKKWNDKYNT